MLVVVAVPADEIRAVLFDLRNTLINREGWLRRVFERFYKSIPMLRMALPSEDGLSRLVEWDNGGYADRARLYKQALETWPEIRGTPSE